jgi:hypothetical protein
MVSMTLTSAATDLNEQCCFRSGFRLGAQRNPGYSRASRAPTHALASGMQDQAAEERNPTTSTSHASPVLSAGPLPPSLLVASWPLCLLCSFCAPHAGPQRGLFYPGSVPWAGLFRARVWRRQCTSIAEIQLLKCINNIPNGIP